MANTYPLKAPTATKYLGKSPSATTDEAAQYKDMLGFQAAGEDVGLFYQLNQVAADKLEASRNIGNYSGPIEAGGVYS